MIAAWIARLLLELGAVACGEPVAALPPKGADLVLLEEVRRIAQNVERLREEPFGRRPVAVRVPDDVQGTAVEIRVGRVMPRNRLEARGRAWAEIGLGSEKSPERLLSALAQDLTGIGFDPDGNRLLVSPEQLSPKDFEPWTNEGNDPATILQLTGVRLDEPRISHLLTHVRQRERRGADFLLPTTDRMLAAAAWAEGEANLVAIRYLFRGMELDDEVLRHELDPRDVLGGRLVPGSLGGGVEQALVEFVYLEGFARAVEAYRGGGWSALDLRMRSATTTRQLVDPEAGGLPAPSWSSCGALEGQEPADEDSLGQQAIVVLISETTGKENLGLLAADGWAGDRLCRWEAPGGGITEWRTSWAVPGDADDFAYAYGRSLAARFPGAKPGTAADGTLEIETQGRRFRLERVGLELRLRVVQSAARP